MTLCVCVHDLDVCICDLLSFFGKREFVSECVRVSVSERVSECVSEYRYSRTYYTHLQYHHHTSLNTKIALNTTYFKIKNNVIFALNAPHWYEQPLRPATMLPWPSRQKTASDTAPMLFLL